MNRKQALQIFENGGQNYRLICQLFYGYSDQDMKNNHVHHIDGDHSNNHPMNLLKCTQKEHASIHSDEKLCEWISLQHYASVKGGVKTKEKWDNFTPEELRAAKAKVSALSQCVWETYTPEQRTHRMARAAEWQRSHQGRRHMSKILSGGKKAPRKLEHTDNWLKSKSKGLYGLGNKVYWSSSALSRELSVPSTNVYRWCTVRNNAKITMRTVNKYPQIFNQTDLGKTFKEKGFAFLSKNHIQEE